MIVVPHVLSAPYHSPLDASSIGSVLGNNSKAPLSAALHNNKGAIVLQLQSNLIIHA